MKNRISQFLFYLGIGLVTARGGAQQVPERSEFLFYLGIGLVTAQTSRCGFSQTVC